VLLSIILTACGQDATDDEVTVEQNTQALSESSQENTGQSDKSIKKQSLVDLDGIKKNGFLRILVSKKYQFQELIRTESNHYKNELKSILEYAKQNNLKPVFIPLNNNANLIPALKSGLGDIIASKLTINDEKKKHIDFTHPLYYFNEQLIIAKSFDRTLSIDQLDNLKIGVKKHTSFWETILKLKQVQKNIQIVELSQKTNSDEKINKINSGELDAVIENSNNLILLKEYRDDFKTALQLSKERSIVWGVRKNNPELLKSLNQYIKVKKLKPQLPDVRLGDLDEIKKSRQLRLITRNSSSTYFLWKNKLMGFEYDLVKKFAKQQKLNLKILIAEDFSQMIQWLENGYGDLISSGLIKTLERKKLPVNFSQPYLFIEEIIVQRKDEEAIKTVRDLDERTFYVRKSSTYWKTLLSFQSQLDTLSIKFTIKPAPENLTTEEIISKVIAGEYDLTLADSHIIAIEKNWQK